MPNVSLPTFTATVDQRFFLEPLGGSLHPENYLDRFPDELYNKAPDAHWVRFMYALLGPAGIGWLKKNYLDARLALIDHGFETFNLERYYGNPFRFPRIVFEQYEQDPTGLLTRDEWDEIKAKDEQYRSRAIDFFMAARAGSTPLGMRLAARSGLDHEVEIIENYKSLFDLHSDEPKGFVHYGRTTSISEFTVLPRLEIGRSEIQKISITGFPIGGSFTLIYRGQATVSIPFDATYNVVQDALASLSTIGAGNIEVSGGLNRRGVYPSLTTYPSLFLGGLPTSFPAFVVRFTGKLTNQDIPQLEATSAFLGGVDPDVNIITERSGQEAADETVIVNPQLGHNLQTALDYLRPVNTLPTSAAGRGLQSRQPWQAAAASSQYQEVLRYVTGTRQVPWPAVDALHWIEAGSEKVGPRVKDDRQHHYSAFHRPKSLIAYDDRALADPNYKVTTEVLRSYPTLHIGNFDPTQASVFPILNDGWSTTIFTVDRILADYPEPLTVTTQNYDATQATSTTAPTQATSFINGIYPADYASLPGVPPIRYPREEQFWASRERTEGADLVEIDLGSAQAVNFITFELTGKPIDIAIDYDTLDCSPRRNFRPVTPVARISFPTSITYQPGATNPWEYLEFNFSDGRGEMIYTRYVRLMFTRRVTPNVQGGRFLYNPTTMVSSPFSIDVRNLRIGRNTV